MTLCREVDHNIGLLFLKETIDTLPVADVKLRKAEVGSFHHRGQCTQIPGIGKLVNADNPIVRVFGKHMEDEVASDETGSSGNDDGHTLIPYLSFGHSFKVCTVWAFSVSGC